ncbi:uncharacterized protein B0I36DRAFT_101304 [Microdochium trichocladiopsis]|uniref:Uncharacterized protein n=1 Tax=Microdochium trichocladiopsis TaxID=1682393 RepID=A0A9P8YAL6_9PEZI|nr:uncharacterized protein B0I36DRAFT_101304 [Microdochium trichocladiopsis]KAH7032849.1 hypothetical protein B0I36DRAFT_101304 [Microdochium trichocladiopsis]
MVLKVRLRRAFTLRRLAFLFFCHVWHFALTKLSNEFTAGFFCFAMLDGASQTEWWISPGRSSRFLDICRG